MKARLNYPIAIGGVGGSGTRIVAQILAELGIYMGDDLNEAYDNLWFTILFRRPSWIAWLMHPTCNNNVMSQALEIFRRLMQGQVLTPWQRIFVEHAMAELSDDNLPETWHWSDEWLDARRHSIDQAQHVDASEHIGWGWKEPNSHIFISYLQQAFPTMKYIHVIRHGLDMAFSYNQYQLFNWGPLFNIEAPQKDEDIPTSSLSYWIQANRNATNLGKIHFGNNMFVLSFDQLCSTPRQVIDELLNFLDIDTSLEKRHQLVDMVKKPDSLGRYHDKLLLTFSQSQLGAVRSFGFEVVQN